MKYITDFPYNDELEEIPVEIDEIGLLSVRIAGDSLLLLGHKDSWSLYSINGERNYGNFLSIGQGPEEFTSIPYVRNAVFEAHNDSLWAYIPDQFNGRIMAFNVTEFISNGNQRIIPNNSEFLKGTKWGVVVCGKDRYHILEPFDDFRGLRRMYVSGDSITEIPGTQLLSAPTVKQSNGGADLNLLSSVVEYIPGSEKFVESMVGLNQINVYSLDGSSATTICVGDKLDNLAKIEDSSRYKREDKYRGSCANMLGFGAIYSGHTGNPLESQNTEIQFFNWDNEQVYRIKQSFEAFGMDLDLTHKRLWVIDKSDDELRCYDATPIINAYLNK